MDTRNFVGPKATVLFVTVVTAGGQEAEVAAGGLVDDPQRRRPQPRHDRLRRGRPRADADAGPDDRPRRHADLEGRADGLGQPGRSTPRSSRRSARHRAVSYTLTVSLKPDAPAGLLRDEIRILTNDPETASIPVLVTALVRGDLSASPSVLALGQVTSAGGVQGRFLVRASKPFTITPIEGAGDGFKVGPTDDARKPVHVVTVAYRPEEGTTRGDLRRIFRILTDLPGEPPVDLTATAARRSLRVESHRHASRPIRCRASRLVRCAASIVIDVDEARSRRLARSADFRSPIAGRSASRGVRSPSTLATAAGHAPRPMQGSSQPTSGRMDPP